MRLVRFDFQTKFHKLTASRELTDLSDDEYQKLLRAAQDWRYLIVKSGKMATKSKLDEWLMRTYNLSSMAARIISNSEENHPFEIWNGEVHCTAKRPEPKLKDYPTIKTGR